MTHINPLMPLGGDLQGTLPNPTVAAERLVLALEPYLPHEPRIPKVQAGANITIVENALGPVISGSGGGGGTFGQTTADFGTAPSVSMVMVTVADAGVGAASKILVAVAPNTGRDLDEMELGPVVASPGNIVPGVSFDILAAAVDDCAEGVYLLNYTRS